MFTCDCQVLIILDYQVTSQPNGYLLVQSHSRNTRKSVKYVQS